MVIGETAEIGDSVTIYHGATLGGKVNHKTKRHPTVESGVVIGAGAKIIGDITIGRGSRVSANAVVTKSLPANSLAISVNTRIVKIDDKNIHDYNI